MTLVDKELILTTYTDKQTEGAKNTCLLSRLYSNCIILRENKTLRHAYVILLFII